MVVLTEFIKHSKDDNRVIETHDGKEKEHDCHQIVRCGVCRDFQLMWLSNRKGGAYGTRTIQSTIFFRKFLPNHLYSINLCQNILAPFAGGRLFTGCSPTCIPERGFGVRFFALLFCLAMECFPMRDRLIS